MKFIRNGIIYEPHSEMVIEQMKKSGYQVYEDTKKEVTEVQPEVKEVQKKKKKK